MGLYLILGSGAGDFSENQAVLSEIWRLGGS